MRKETATMQLAHHVFRPWTFEGDRCVKAPEAEWRKPLELNGGHVCEFCGVLDSSHERCESCGYSWCDVQIHGDHHLCGKPQPDKAPRPRVLLDADPFVEWRYPVYDHQGYTIDKGESYYETSRGGARRHCQDVVTVTDLTRDLFRLIDQCPNVDWVIRTEHPERIWKAGFGDILQHSCGAKNPNFTNPGAANYKCDCGEIVNRWYRPNVLLGTIARNQAEADARAETLVVRCRDLSPVLFVHFIPTEEIRIPWLPERLETPIQKRHQFTIEGLDWVIASGGSDPVHPDWVRSLRDQTQAAGVPFWFDGWGEWMWDIANPFGIEGKETHLFAYPEPTTIVNRVGQQASGRELDGQTWEQVPEVTNG